MSRYGKFWFWMITIGLVMLLAIILALYGGDQAYKCAYNEGYDAGYSEALSPWLEVQPEIQWHSIEMSRSEPDWIVGDSVAGWYSPSLSSTFIREWYDRAADSTHKMYEKAFTNWAMSILTKEKRFVIYFDSTDTITSLYNCSGYVYSSGGKRDDYPLHRIVKPWIRSWLIYGPQYHPSVADTAHQGSIQ